MPQPAQLSALVRTAAWLQNLWAGSRSPARRSRLTQATRESGVERLTSRILLAAEFSNLFGNELVGVDFGRPSNGSPTNWTAFGGSSDTTLSNLIDESGAATPFDLAIDYVGGGGLADNPIFPAHQLPQHAQPLDLLSGNIWQSTGSNLNLVFSDLIPGRDYEVYVFGGDTVAGNNRVTITGENQVAFNQQFAPNQLYVNGLLGSNSVSLGSFAEIVTASSTGTITIAVTHPNSGFYSVAGVAIREGTTGTSEPPAFDHIFTTNYAAGSPPRILAPNGTLADPDSSDFDGGQLRVHFSLSGIATDRLGINHQGTQPGQVGVNGSFVTYGGTLIGTLSGGVGTQPLIVTFNAAATVEAAQAVLRNVFYWNVSDNPTEFGTQSVRIVSYTMHDGDGGTSGPMGQAIYLTSPFDNPVLGNITTQTYTRNSAPKQLAPAATVADPNSADFDTGTLTVRYTAGGLSSDRLTIRRDGSLGGVGNTITLSGLPIATFTGGMGTTPLVITFTERANLNRVQLVLRNLLYHNVSDNPTNSGANPSRTINYVLTDGDGGTSEAVNQTLNILSGAQKPVLDGISSPQSYLENSPAKKLAPAATVADPDSENFDAGALTVKYLGGALGTDRLSIRHVGDAAGQVGVEGETIRVSGIAVATFTGGDGATPLVVTFNAAAIPVRVQAVVRNIQYENLSDNPTNFGARPSRTVQYVLTDGDGGTSAAVNQTLDVTARNDAAVVTGFDDATNYRAGTGATVLDGNAIVSDADSRNFDAGSLTVSISSGGAATNHLGIRHRGDEPGQVGVSGDTVSVGGTAIGTFTGGIGPTPLVVTFNEFATPARVQALVRNLTYHSAAASPTGPKTVRLALRDGDGGTSIVTKTLNIQAAP